MFAAILGHDLRTPLGAIMMGASYLEATLDQQTEALATASRILNSGNRMGRLITDILDFSRIRLGGELPVIFVDMDMEEICRDVVDEVVAAYPEEVVTVESTGNVSGRWDRERVGQVVSNLVNNALQHGGRDTQVLVALREEDDEVLLSVHNWGPVITAQNIACIFDPGMRLAAAGRESRHQGSLGLGLHIVHLIVVAHGGKVVVESTDELGTTFTVHWPKSMNAA
jgi:signal transduction histidine kinase